MIRLTVVLILLTYAGIVLAQHTGHGDSMGGTHSHPAQDEAIHLKFYMTWTRPDNRTLSCCNRHDCYPTEFKQSGGTWFAKRREDGAWIPVPERKLEHNTVDPRESPDGRNHICMQAPGSVNMVFCAVHGAGI